MKSKIIKTALAGMFISVCSSANAGIIYQEDFESDSNTWNPYSSTVINESGNGVVDGSIDNTGAFTRFGGYSSTFGSGYSTSLDVFIDPTAWILGTGFDYSSAANGQDGLHLRDFIFNAGQTSQGFVINASNNSAHGFNEFSILGDNDYFTVSDSGWYTLEHNFFDLGGFLAVDFNIYDGSGSLLHTERRSSNLDDIAASVGGNRYGWIVYNDNTLRIDNSILRTTDVPEPSTLAIFALGIMGLASRKFKQQ